MLPSLHVPFLAEVPTCSFVAGDMPLGEFFTRIVDVSGCKVVLDLGHLVSYCLYRDESIKRVLSGFPLSAIWEFHIAGAKINDSHPYRYIDTHSDPVLPAVYRALSLGLALCPNVRAITYEIGNRLKLDHIEKELDLLDQAIGPTGFTPKLAGSHA